MQKETLKAVDVTKAFGGVKAIDLKGCTLAFEPGKITAVLGGNGAGKTTLFNLLNGAVRPDSGCVFFGANDITYMPVWKRFRFGISRLWQDIRLFPELDCIENIQVAIRGQHGENALHALISPRLVRKGEAETRSRAISVLKDFGISDIQDHLASDISYGQQKLLAIARIICNQDVKVALLDEPMAGLDKQFVQKVSKLVCDMRDKRIAVVIIEHDLHAIRGIVDHTIFLDQGRCVATGSLEDVLKSPDIRRRYIGL